MLFSFVQETYVSGHIHCSAHDDDFLGAKEGFWVCSRSQGQVRQRTNRDNSDCIWFVLTQDTEDLLVGGAFRWDKCPLRYIASWDGFDIDVICRWAEKMLPGFFGGEVRVLE